MNKFCLSVCCLFLVLFANAQERKWQYRIGLDAFGANLVNVEELPATRRQHKDYGAVIPRVEVARKLNEKWAITAGIGFIRHKSAFPLDYTEIPLFNHLEYVAVPIVVQYKVLSWGNNKSWHLEGSIWNKLLVDYESNLPTMLMSGGDLLYIPANPSRYVLNARLGTNVTWTLKNKHAISVAGFISRDITPYLSERNNSFMLTLRPSRYLFGGFGFSYSL